MTSLAAISAQTTQRPVISRVTLVIRLWLIAERAEAQPVQLRSLTDQHTDKRPWESYPEAGGRSLRCRRLLPCGGVGNGVTTSDRKLYRRVILCVGFH